MTATLLTVFAMALAQLGPEPTGPDTTAPDEDVQRIELRGEDEPEAAEPVTGPGAPDRTGATAQEPAPGPGDPAGEGVGGTGAGDEPITTIELQGTPDPASPDGPAVVPPGGVGGTGASPGGQADTATQGSAPGPARQQRPGPTAPAATGSAGQPAPQQQVGTIDESAIPGLGGSGADLSNAQQLQQQIGALQRQMASNQVYNQQLAQQIQSLQAQLEQQQAQEVEDEANRQTRIAVLNDATNQLRDAQAQLTTGDTDVTGLLANARTSLEQALSLTGAGTGGEMESRWIQEALAAVDTSIQGLENLDLFNARVALGMAIVHTGSATAAAMER